MSGAVCTLRPWVHGCVVFVVVMGGITAQTVRADDEETAEPPQGQWLDLTHLDAYLEFEAEWTRSRVRAADRRPFRSDREQTNRERRFEERVGLSLGGVVLDPSFISFSADLSFALTQDHFTEVINTIRRRDSDSGHLLQYDARINFFQGKPISGSLYALRQEDRINRRFQPSLDEERTGFGTSWVFTHDKFPMELSYDYLETDRTGNRDRRDDEHYTESNLHYAFKWLMTDRQRLKFSYEHAETKQAFQGLSQGFDTTRDLFEIEHELEFGDEAQHNLRTLIHWQEESGDFARDLFEIGPQLTLKHSDTLQTMYKYQFNRERYEGLDIESQRADFQLIHQIYTNLTTTFGVFGLYEDVEDDINTTQYGTYVDWQYNRKNPYGHFYANLALAYDTEEVDGDNGVRVILDESHTLRDPVAVILRNRNVIHGTIVVTDTSNRRFYQPGVDYAVFRQGNVTRIARVRTGRISDGDTILVDYQFRTPARGQLDTIRVDFSLEQRFDNGLTPYYRLSYRNQEDDTSFGFARRADRTDHHRVGINYEAERFNLGFEYEIFDDTVEPYDAFHLDGMLHILQHPDHAVDFSTRLSRFYFEGGFDERDVTIIDLAMDHRWRLTEMLSTVERVAYRFEDDSVAGDTHAWDVVAGLTYTVGDLSSELTVEYDRLNLPDSNDEDVGIYFRVRREIPNVFATR